MPCEGWRQRKAQNKDTTQGRWYCRGRLAQVVYAAPRSGQAVDSVADSSVGGTRYEVGVRARKLAGYLPVPS